MKQLTPFDFQSPEAFINHELHKRGVAAPAAKRLKIPRLDRKNRAIDFPASPHGYYWVPLDECSTHRQIIQWVMHLTDKDWMTKEHMRTFIRLACDFHGLPIW